MTLPAVDMAMAFIFGMEGLFFVGLFIAVCSTAKEPDKRKPGDRTEDNEFGLGFGCALLVSSVIALVAAGIVWLATHVTIRP